MRPSRRKNIGRRLLILALMAPLILLFQNCSKKPFTPLNLKQGSLLTVDCLTPAACQAKDAAAQLILNRTKHIVNVDCFNDPSVNSCLFYKNPLASRGRAFPTIANHSMDLSPYQNFGVNIDANTYDGSGCLTNSSYTVISNVSVLLPTAAGTPQINDTRFSDTELFRGDTSCFSDFNFKKSYLNDSTFQVSALMAHYYLNYQAQFMTEWTGTWYGTDQATKVYSYIANSSFNNNAAFIGGSGIGIIAMGVFMYDATGSTLVDANPGLIQEAALSAEAYLHEAGHANFYYANPNLTDSLTKHKICGSNSDAYCCTTAAGCIAAINEGLADYHALMLFPSSPTIGDTIVNSVHGFSESGVTRNYNDTFIRNLLPDTAYNAPADYSGSTEYNGEVHVSGRIWASIWFEARRRISAEIGPRGVRTLDKVFSAHLLSLSGGDTFKTACQKIINDAANIDSGLVESYLAAECSRRGLN